MKNNADIMTLILEEIEAYSVLSGGKCGIRPLDVANNINMDYTKIRTPLNTLLKQKKIKVRKGINSNLIFKI